MFGSIDDTHHVPVLNQLYTRIKILIACTYACLSDCTCMLIHSFHYALHTSQYRSVKESRISQVYSAYLYLACP